MSTAQINGSPSTETSTKNNGGAVVANSVSNNMTSLPFVSEDVGVFGSQVVNGINTAKAIQLGVFNYDHSDPIAMKVTSSLAAISNDFLISGANYPEGLRPINNLMVDIGSNNNGPVYAEGTRTTLYSTAFRDGKLSIMTGKFSAGYPVVSVDNFETTPSNKYNIEAPGTLVFTLKTQVSKNYSKKTG